MPLPGQPCATQHWALTLHTPPFQNPTHPLGPPHLLASRVVLKGQLQAPPLLGPPGPDATLPTSGCTWVGGVARMLTTVPLGAPTP